MLPPTVAWYVCDLMTGRILGELPLSGDTVRRRIANVEQVTLTLPVFDPACPPDWDATLVPGRTMVVLTLDAVPAQAWVVLDAPVGDVTVAVACATLEECLARTNVPDVDPYALDAAGADYTDVAAALLAPVVSRFGCTLDTEASGKRYTGDQTYSVLEDRTVLDALNADIMGADGGPEWRIGVEWADDTHRAFRKRIEVRPRVGADRPDVIFDLDANGNGTIESYSRTRSYAAGKGATMMIGTGEGSGEGRPMTDPQMSPFVAAGWPVWEERYQFAGIDAADPDAEMLARTRALLSTRQDGAETWTITGRDTAAMPGRDYAEGDTIRVDVAASPPRDPSGGRATLRLLGWDLNLTSMQATLLLWDDGGGDGG